MYDRVKHLLSTELLYHKKQLWGWFGFLTFGLLYIGLRDHHPRRGYTVIFDIPLQEEFTLILWLMIAVHAYLTYKFITSSKMELRSYFLLSLPFNRSDIGLSRLLYVLFIHGAAFVLLAGFVLLLLEPTQLRLGRYVNASAFEVKEIILWTATVMIFLSYCISVSVLLLESRRQRPLLTTLQWMLMVVILLPVIFSVFGLRFAFRPNRTIISIVSSGPQTGYLLVPVIPVMGLVAVYLSVVYQRRVARLRTWRE
ncbi:hypothetical protein ACFL41_00700 [Gemmatimonadota bacterium]